VFSRFRLAGVGVVVGVALVGAVFYAAFNSHYLSHMVGRTLGPYSDSLAEHIFANRDPEVWRKIAERHHVYIIVESPDGTEVGFDSQGRPLTGDLPGLQGGQLRAVRTAPDGTRVIFHWSVWSFHDGNLPLLVGLLIMVGAVVGSAFWFLQRQLRPLAWLHDGVEAVAAGDFKTRVPVVRDDEIGHVARAFNDMTARVGEMVDDRERLLGDVSHELRSPISRMKVALEFMPEGEKRDGLARDLREMESLISVLLEREELRSREGRLGGDEVDLRAVAERVASGYTGKGPGVEVVSDGAVTFHADPALMRLLLRNLVDNAVKFSRPDSGPVEVRLESREDGATLRVIDDGIGIPAADRARVFEPFVKLNRARGHGVGHGLGLNLCQRVVELYGGTIELRGRDAAGSPRGLEVVVTFLWPVATGGGGTCVAGTAHRPGTSRR
jgi:signal transduction histidine kinase